MKFILNGKTYPMSDVNRATLYELMLLEQQTADAGRSLSLATIHDMEERISAIPDAQQRGMHPDALWLLAATIWLARRRAGEQVTFVEATDFSLEDIDWVHEPGDVTADAPDATADPHQRRAASEQGPARRAPADRKSKASKKASTAA